MITYKQAGVDIEAGYEVVKRIKKVAKGIGLFGGLFPFGKYYLVGATDGVGTKLKLAFALNKHQTIGIDLVAMNVDDVVAMGAKPLFFLDYIALQKVDPNLVEKVVKGMGKDANRRGSILSAVRRPSFRICTRRGNMIWPVLRWGSWKRTS
jgi:phosphoribosylformylglycinamidine cyclo-ligase